MSLEGSKGRRSKGREGRKDRKERRQARNGRRLKPLAAENAPTGSRRPANDLSRSVIGAAIEVHRCLGPGLLEKVYEQAMALELSHRGILFERQVPGGIRYRGHSVGDCRLDFLVEKSLVLELKSVEHLTKLHRAQVIAYLRIYGLRVGLLLNFNSSTLKNGIVRVLNPV